MAFNAFIGPIQGEKHAQCSYIDIYPRSRLTYAETTFGLEVIGI